MLSARAFPPFLPIATAAGSLPCSSGVGSRSGFSPVAMSMIDLASWLGSLGRFGALGILFRLPLLQAEILDFAILKNPMRCNRSFGERFGVVLHGHFCRWSIW